MLKNIPYLAVQIIIQFSESPSGTCGVHSVSFQLKLTHFYINTQMIKAGGKAFSPTEDKEAYILSDSS